MDHSKLFETILHGHHSGGAKRIRRHGNFSDGPSRGRDFSRRGPWLPWQTDLGRFAEFR